MHRASNLPPTQLPPTSSPSLRRLDLYPSRMAIPKTSPTKRRPLVIHSLSPNPNRLRTMMMSITSLRTPCDSRAANHITAERAISMVTTVTRETLTSASLPKKSDNSLSLSKSAGRKTLCK
ncbi:hypothetical protein NP493_1119g00047 [Ridgeia piscesae]|uniref:Uncharacterized protein n=1 Tax=Ridgeia piscesae TaxID=27915 RepID=A0AAD9KH35_RIDPI|nr:hypothetical protein NP493_1119g00047 [Ridgeia piscesae]